MPFYYNISAMLSFHFIPCHAIYTNVMQHYVALQDVGSALNASFTSGFSASMTYFVTVSAIVDGVLSGPSYPTTTIIGFAQPARPAAPVVETIKTNGVVLRWYVPANSGKPIDYFIVHGTAESPPGFNSPLPGHHGACHSPWDVYHGLRTVI